MLKPSDVCLLDGRGRGGGWFIVSVVAAVSGIESRGFTVGALCNVGVVGALTIES